MVILLRTQNVVNVLILRGAHNREKTDITFTHAGVLSLFLLFI